MKCKLPVVDLVILSALKTNPAVLRSFFWFPGAWHNERREVQKNARVQRQTGGATS